MTAFAVRFTRCFCFQCYTGSPLHALRICMYNRALNTKPVNKPVSKKSINWHSST